MPDMLFPQAVAGHPPLALASPQMRARIEAMDWAATGLGAMGGWSETLRAHTRMILASPVPMVLLAGREGVLVYNDAYAAFAGRRHPDILGLPAARAWPEIADYNQRIIEMGFRGETLSLENQELVLHRSGAPESVWMDLEYSPMLGEDGRPEGVFVIVYETTARVKAERALKRSEERLAIALDAAGMVGTWEWDLGSDRVSGDARFAAMVGVSAVEAEAGLDLAAYERALHPDDLSLVRDRLARALQRGEPYRIEYRLKAAAEAPSRWVLAAGRVDKDESGRPVRLSGVAIDISERKAQEAALATSEAKFRALADTMPQMVWSALPDGFHDYYNARWYEFTGVPVGSTDGEGWNGMFHPDDQSRARARWRESLETGEPYEIEYRLRHRSGEYRWTLGRALPILDAEGRTIRWFGTCTDIHDTKKAAEEREMVAQELSHRIKNIFSVLSGIIALSARSSPAAAKPFAEQLKRRIFAMGQAHDFVRPHSAASKPAENQNSLKALTQKLLQPFGGAEGGTIRWRGDDAVIDEAAATPIALLFHELATNAAKYGALCTPDGRVELTGRRDGEDFCLEWKERGGPLVAEPAAEGFGSRLVALSVEGQLGGTAQRLWETDGLRVDVRVPLAALRRSGKLNGAATAHRAEDEAA